MGTGMGDPPDNPPPPEKNFIKLEFLLNNNYLIYLIIFILFTLPLPWRVDSAHV